MKILADIDGGILTIRLNRPEVLNAFDPEAYHLFGLAVQRAMAADVRVVVLTGAGRAFSSGHDLTAMPGDDPASDLRWTDGAVRGLATLEKPVIAAINGVAAGGGLSLALACDFRLMSQAAKLVPAFPEAGLAPDFGASWLLARSMGADAAFRWIATGGQMGPEAALAAGLATEIVAADLLADRTRDLAALLAQRPTRALGLAKTLLHAASSASLSEMLEREARAQAQAASTADYREALAAFRAKRKPVFTGA